MKRDQLERVRALRSEDIDSEAFAAALTVHYRRRLISNGGIDRGRPDDETAFHFQHLERFLTKPRHGSWVSRPFDETKKTLLAC